MKEYISTHGRSTRRMLGRMIARPISMCVHVTANDKLLLVAEEGFELELLMSDAYGGWGT